MLDLIKDSVTLSAFFLTVSNHLGSQALDLFQFVILVSYEMFWLACPTIYELILVSVGAWKSQNIDWYKSESSTQQIEVN